MLEIDHFADRRLGGEQVFRPGRGQSQERDGVFRGRGRDGADERQMPDDIADPSFDLDDGGGRHAPSIVMPRENGASSNHRNICEG